MFLGGDLADSVLGILTLFWGHGHYCLMEFNVRLINFCLVLPSEEVTLTAIRKKGQ